MAHSHTVLLRKATNMLGTEKRNRSIKKSEFYNITKIHPTITILIDFLEKKGQETEGLFRVNASVSGLANFKEEIMNSTNITVSDEWDPCVVAGLIKLLLRELEEPLFLFSSYESLMSASDCKELKQKLQKLKSVVDSLPIGNKGLLFKLLNLFSTIDKNQQETKMSAHNLAVVMGPTLIRSSGESFETMMTDSSKVVSVVTSLIVNLPYFQKN